MRYLLDLPVIVEALRRRPAPPVTAWLERNAAAGFATAALVMAELQAAVARMPESAGRNHMAAWARELQDSLADAILPFDAAAAQAYARLRAREAGTTGLTALDALVAATAQAHGLVLATRDPARLGGWCGAAEDPWQG